jgi:lysine-specific demethylase/histidyl-hydroxylase NO66
VTLPGGEDQVPGTGVPRALERCVGDARRFVEETWGRHVLVRRSEEDAYADLLSLDDVDHLLSSAGLRVPAFRLVRDGAPLPTPAYTRSGRIGGVLLSGVADPARVFDEFERGATIVLQGLHRYWPPLTRLCRDLELALGHPCQVNAYITPPGAQGFARHTDTHDVLVLQTFGTKVWEIYPTPAEQAGGAGAAREVTLAAGTALYLPTGTPHAARTQQSMSGHLTVGVLTSTWKDVLASAVTELLDGDTFAEPLPAGYHTDPATMAKLLAERLDALRDQLAAADAEGLSRAWVDRFLRTRPAMLRGGLVDRTRLAALDDETPVRRRPGAVCELRSGGERLRLLLGDRELRLPAWVEPAVRQVLDRERLAVGELAPLLDAESRQVLVRRLVREGLLEVCG